jgi:transposase
LLPALVRTTAENFRIGEVSADKGYLSAENVEAIAELGGTPFIAPKCNTTGGVGGLFERMYHFYAFNREAFLAAYHKRSNVESTFSAVKRKFGDHVRSKADAAMRNEVLCKLLCHNLCCVIRSQIELGMETTFWPENDGGPRDVLPLVRRG